MSFIIGLTGPTGAGKSMVSAAAEQFGLRVVNCDLLARKAVEKGMEGLKALTAVFGNGILEKDGSLNRKELAAVAFKTPENTELLNKTLLPHIVKLVKEETNSKNALLDAPTLFESGLNSECVKTIAVLADKKLREERITARDNITKQQALLRINAGKSDDFYKTHADCIIYNNGDENAVITRFSNILKEITEEITNE
ncbi:MAG TPA: dephospho-CoA kinase [Ruminococcaceae bacterium]|nr:dephospho-CoA kinase [Oscillospiraceae bacterium]